MLFDETLLGIIDKRSSLGIFRENTHLFAEYFAERYFGSLISLLLEKQQRDEFIIV